MFDVINDAWIKTDKGKFGIRELLRRAPEINEISGENPLNEFAIYRFLFVFLMDAFRPETVDDCIDNIYEAGSFDMDRIDAYVEMCRKEGVTFDIFDKERPFLQEPASTFDKKDSIKSIGNLDKTVPAGTNKRFFDKRYENNVYMPADKIARFLTTTTLYNFGGNGYKTCISGTPVYHILKGRNLFETLVFGIIPIRDARRGYGKPYWRYGNVRDIGVKDAPVVEPDFLFALTLPIRRVCVIDERSAYYKGAFYYEAPSWRDPYVAYINDKSLKPQKEFYRRWTDLLTLADPKEDSLDTISIYSGHLKDIKQPIRIVSYEALPAKSRYSDMRKNVFPLTPAYIGDSDKLKAAKILAEDMKSAAWYLSSAVRGSFPDKLTDAYTAARFHEKADDAFERELEKGTLDEAAWLTKLKALAEETFSEALERKASTPVLAAAMKQRAMMLGAFKNKINKLNSDQPDQKGDDKNGRGSKG